MTNRTLRETRSVSRGGRAAYAVARIQELSVAYGNPRHPTKGLDYKCILCHASRTGGWKYDGGPDAYNQAIQVVDADDPERRTTTGIYPDQQANILVVVYYTSMR